jgi:hypothetical protein
MTYVKPPCGKNCPHRTVGCHCTCEAWGQYEKEREKMYEERRNKVIFASQHFESRDKEIHRSYLKRRK